MFTLPWIEQLSSPVDHSFTPSQAGCEQTLCVRFAFLLYSGYIRGKFRAHHQRKKRSHLGVATSFNEPCSANEQNNVMTIRYPLRNALSSLMPYTSSSSQSKNKPQPVNSTRQNDSASTRLSLDPMFWGSASKASTQMIQNRSLLRASANIWHYFEIQILSRSQRSWRERERERERVCVWVGACTTAGGRERGII